MHGFALNVNTDLAYLMISLPVAFNINRLPLFKKNSAVKFPVEIVKEKLKTKFQKSIDVELVESEKLV